MGQYYVYVYIDPRNYEEFYYGKGMGSRKDSHLYEIDNDSEKSKRIKAIKEEGQSPIIRVIAADLSENEAHLIEKTLLWKLGKHLTNISSGHYSDKFRPHNTLHKTLSGFDFKNGVYYYNVGECDVRNWDDYIKFGFISAGQGLRWKEAIMSFKQGDVIAAYLKSYGYVGIGKIIDKAIPIRNFILDGKPLLNHDLICKEMNWNVEDDNLCEYICRVEWIKSVNRNMAKWKTKSGLFTTTHVRASLDNQKETILFLNEKFGVDLYSLVQ